MTATFLHVPGLWLLFGERPPRRLLLINLLVVLLTVAVLALLWLFWGGRAVLLEVLLVTWGLAHLGWGVYLASRPSD